MAISAAAITITFGLQGIVICVANGLLLLTILLKNSLRKRKEMLIIAGMAGIDVLYGLGALQLATYRVIITAQGQQNETISAWDCIKLPWFFTMYIGLQLTSVMNVVLSCDRLIAVAWPIKYRTLDQRYARNVLSMVALFGLASLVAMLLSTYFERTNLPTTKTCSSNPFTHWYNLYQWTLIAGAGCLSVAIYICVFIVYRRMVRQTKHHSTIISSSQSAPAQQRRLTVTLGIITLSTFILFIIPFLIFAVCTWMNVPVWQSTLLGTISRFSTLINVAIYVYRQKDVRREIWAFLVCKKEAMTNFSSVRAMTNH